MFRFNSFSLKEKKIASKSREHYKKMKNRKKKIEIRGLDSSSAVSPRNYLNKIVFEAITALPWRQGLPSVAR